MNDRIRRACLALLIRSFIYILNCAIMSKAFTDGYLYGFAFTNGYLSGFAFTDGYLSDCAWLKLSITYNHTHGSVRSCVRDSRDHEMVSLSGTKKWFSLTEWICYIADNVSSNLLWLINSFRKKYFKIFLVFSFLYDRLFGLVENN